MISGKEQGCLLREVQVSLSTDREQVEAYFTGKSRILLYLGVISYLCQCLGCKRNHLKGVAADLQSGCSQSSRSQRTCTELILLVSIAHNTGRLIFYEPSCSCYAFIALKLHFSACFTSQSLSHSQRIPCDSCFLQKEALPLDKQISLAVSYRSICVCTLVKTARHCRSYHHLGQCLAAAIEALLHLHTCFHLSKTSLV